MTRTNSSFIVTRQRQASGGTSASCRNQNSKPCEHDIRQSMALELRSYQHHPSWLFPPDSTPPKEAVDSTFETIPMSLNNGHPPAAVSSPCRPQVPQIHRRSLPCSIGGGASHIHATEEATVASIGNDASATTTDEFGFPIPQTRQPPPTRIDLDRVITPTHVRQQQQRRRRPPHPHRPPALARAARRTTPPHPAPSHSLVSASATNADLPRRRHRHDHDHPVRGNNKFQEASPPTSQKYQHYTFQHPLHAMRVTLRTMDLYQRVAFDHRIPPSSHSTQLQRLVANHHGGKAENPCRISPSPNHMKILEYLHGVGGVPQMGPKQQDGGNGHSKENAVLSSSSSSSSMGGGNNNCIHRNTGTNIIHHHHNHNHSRVIRQLQWNAACSVDADPWFHGQYYDPDNNTTTTTPTSDNDHHNDHPSVPRRKRPSTTSSHCGDGRYLSIHPLSTLQSTLPANYHPPILTNAKRRLPTRADVGFCHPSPEEIAMKMEEVKRESEWEECSPRIVLLASGFSLFRGIPLPHLHQRHRGESNDGGDDGGGGDGSIAVIDEIHPSCKDDIATWAGGSIPGVPFAGRDLVSAARMTAQYDQDINVRSSNNHNNNNNNPPNAYSAFAPPVDATFSSSSLLWRPRPFMDRPPGHAYFLACPLDIRLEGGDTEPLFCAMSLYSLNSRRRSKTDAEDPSAVCGKISEEFFFPAGSDWHGGMDGTSPRSLEDENDDDGRRPLQSWRRRKRRAILSYDPLEVSPRDLYLVIQVCKNAQQAMAATEESEANPLIPMSHPKQKERVGSIIKRTLLSKGKSKGGDVGAIQSAFRRMSFDDGNKDSSNNQRGKISSSLEDVGAPHLTPVCFSVTRAFTENCNHQWPTGKTTQAPFYPFPSSPESQDDFVERLIDTLEDGNTSMNNKQGYANIYTKFLGGDFTRALLEDSKEITDSSSSLGPQLLADVMGDCAISFEGPSAAATAAAGDGKKHRSNLRRLPPSHESGYSSSFDIKEVLYFPPRSAARKYEDNMTFCSNTTINLMFIYPRLIRMSGEKKKGSSNVNSVSVRIQIVEQDFSEGNRAFDGAEGAYEPMEAIYNPTSPAGPPLVESFFTKYADLSQDEIGNSKSGKAKSTSKKDVPLREEIKVRLPYVLDRRHFLQFSIFSVKDSKCDELIAEATIPLIISSKEPCSGGRVTTIMPNGLHRIQLGEEFQVHVETRLASSSHISDPSIATLLRDTPFGKENAVVHPTFGIPFVDILFMASGSAIKRHFVSLMTANMMNLVTQKCPFVYFEPLFDMLGSNATWYRLSSWENTDAMLSIIRCLFEILDKTRISYQEKYGSIVCPQYDRLLKSFLDTFDEPSVADNGNNQDVDIDELVSEWHLDSTDFGDINGGGLSSYKHPDSNRGARSSKYLIKSPKSEIKEAPFSRRAYVPTKTEQLKAEAEMYDDDIYTREFFDDDETVASFSTMTSRTVFPMILESRSFLTESINELREEVPLAHSNSLLTQGSDGNGFNCGKVLGFDTPARSKKTASPTPFSFAGKRAEYVATRVNSVAQLVLAPCVAPSTDDVMSPPRQKMPYASKLSCSSDKNPFDASSDVEDECKTGTSQTLRGSQACLKLPPLVFHPIKEQGDLPDLSTHNLVYVYESITSLWVQSWTSFAALMKGDRILEGSTETIPTWPYEVIQGQSNQSSDATIASSFIRNASFFLPLCLKSLALRCSLHYTTKLIVPMTFVDHFHMRVLVPMVETIALGTMREAMTGGSSAVSNSDQMLTKALSTISVHALDFIIGLFALLHPSQVATLVQAYFNILEECQDPRNRVPESDDKFRLRRIKCSQQIRLYAVERLATIPRFIAFNFPLKYSGSYPKRNPSSTWMNQTPSAAQKNDAMQAYFNKVDRNPATFWLSDLLMSTCLSICNRSCKTIIIEAKAHSNALRFGRGNEGALSREELLRIESIAFHSILCAYELLIKRHASDFRFQTAACNTRVAAMVIGPLLEQSVASVSVLTRMDANHKVRCLWLLCVLYVLQEGPEALLRDKLSGFCRSSDQIHQFIRLLRLTSTTCQFFIPSNESFFILGGLSKEMTQESFNCISATVILLVEECIDHFTANSSELEKLAADVFDLLLHVMATPQSSVTLLRTLGGSAHALDKFGAHVFFNAVGSDLQHWGRVILTMMNSTELSVRSMAVDFFVSLLGGIYKDSGSIDVVSLAVLTVLPEVVAREISLYSVSGLIESIDDIETTLWPLRRALADVEETNPLDDDRIDPQLIPSITTFCRTGQAIIDGVLIEMRLKGASKKIDLSKIAEVQTRPTTAFHFGNLPRGAIFDADEESLLEAANFFSPQTSCPQKLRWLFALRDLHVTKRQWSEAAETLVLGAHSLIKSLEHLHNIWRPTPFDLWNDDRHSPWLKTIGQSEDCNTAVMRFARSFLEAGSLFNAKDQYTYTRQLSVRDVSSVLSLVIDQIYLAYSEEQGMEDIAFSHFEELLNKISAVINNVNRRYHSEDINALRRVRALICSKLTPLTEHDILGSPTIKCVEPTPDFRGGVYVRLVLCGNKPEFLKESTTIPTYFEWDLASICRVPGPMIIAASIMQKNTKRPLEECICVAFAEPLIMTMKDKGTKSSIVLRTNSADKGIDESKTYIDVAVVQRMKAMSSASLKSRKFYLRNDDGITEYTVAHKFPFQTSRQRSLVKSEVKMMTR